MQHIPRNQALEPKLRLLSRVTDKATPSIYFLRVRDLMATRQHLAVLEGVSFPPPLGSRYFFGNGESETLVGTPLRPAKLRQPTACAVCRRPVRSRLTRPHCSAMCELASYLFCCDLLALSGPMIHQFAWSHRPYAAGQLRYLDRRILPPRLKGLQVEHWHDHDRYMLVGSFAEKYGLAYASAIYIHPVALRRCLKRHIKNDTMSKLPAPPPPGSPLELGSLLNPVTKKMADIVLGHLDTANEFLKPRGRGASEKEQPEPVIWTKEQVHLFLGLLNRTIPSVSASLNLSAIPEAKLPHEMTRAELEAAALRARELKNEEVIDHEPQTSL